jgi:hypothetical protein
MNGAFNRDLLPTWPDYADIIGAKLLGRGKWRSMLCEFHADTEPSLRVNTQSGGWRCMSCGAKGGDTLSHYMQRTDAGFREAALALGAWDTSKEKHTERKPRRLSAADAMEVIAAELLVLVVIIGDMRRGVIPTDTDWHRLTVATGRVEKLVMEFRP